MFSLKKILFAVVLAVTLAQVQAMPVLEDGECAAAEGAEDVAIGEPSRQLCAESVR